MTRLDRYKRSRYGMWIAWSSNFAFDGRERMWMLGRYYRRRGCWALYWPAEFSFDCRHYEYRRNAARAYLVECYALDDAEVAALHLLDEGARERAIDGMARAAEEERAR